MQSIAPQKQNEEKDNGGKNNSGSLSQGPHRFAIAAVNGIIPTRHREHVQNQLLDWQVSSSCAYVVWGILYLIFIVARQLWPAFDVWLFLTEALAFGIAFADKPWGEPSAIAVLSGLAGLALCDAYRYPDLRTPFHRGFDAAAAILFVISVQMYETLISPSAALPPPVLLRGAASALLMVSMVRVLFRLRPGPEPFGAASAKLTYLMTVMWLMAAMTVFSNYLVTTPEFFPEQHFPSTYLPTLALNISFLLQKNKLERTWGRGGGKTLFKDLKVVELERQYYWTWAPADAKPGEFPWHTVFELIAFGFFLWPMLMMAGAWYFGFIPPSRMDWLQWTVSSLAMVALFVLWPFIRRANHNLAAALRKAKEERLQRRKIIV